MAVPRTSRPAAVPVALTRFIGRQRELAELREQLAGNRLLTLTGAGGCGKTRLAAQLALDVADRFPDGVWWVDLAPVRDERLVSAAVGHALGVRPLPGVTELEACAAFVTSRRGLLVLDNCEHLLGACAVVVEALLRAGRDVAVLATSRARLSVDGEVAWRVPSLSLPVDGTLVGSDAAALFLDRARHVRRGLALGDDGARAVARICAASDGLPLAIELASARLRMLSVEEIAARMSDRFHLLTGGPRTASTRQQTLRASVDWSYELLSGDERTVLRRLAVFIGGFTLDSAESVCVGDGIESEQVLDLLGSLVDQSLVTAEEGQWGVRYRLLETLRQYALERLGDAGEMQALHIRHCHVFLAFAERARSRLESPAQVQWLERLDSEAANLAAAIEHALANDPTAALRFCAALYRWWRARGRLAEAELAYSRALGACQDREPRLRARVLADRAFVVLNTGDYEAAGVHAMEALALADETGDLATAAHARCYTGQALVLSNPAGARSDLARAAELARRAGDDWALVAAKQLTTSSYLIQFEHAHANRVNDEVAALAEHIGDPFLRGRRWLWHAWPAMHDGRLVEARDALERAQAVWAGVGGPAQDGLAEYGLGLVDAWQGQPERGISRLQTQLERALKHGAGFAVPWLLEALAFTDLAAGRPEAARDRLEGLLQLVRGREGWSTARALTLLAETQRLLADTGAEATAKRAQECSERLDNPFLHTHARLTLARLAASREAWPDARVHAHAHLDVCARGGHVTHVPACLDALAEIASGLGEHEDAVRLLAAADHARAQLGTVRVPAEHDHWASVEAELLSRLGQDPYRTARREGERLSIQDALEWARRGRGPRRRPPSGWSSLTPTEAKVAELLADGLTNPEIAQLMFVSSATVKTHVSHIFGKLGVHTRAELVAQAVRRSVTQ